MKEIKFAQCPLSGEYMEMYTPTPTVDIYHQVMKVLHDMGYSWYGCKSIFDRHRDPPLGDSTVLVIHQDKRVLYGSLEYLEENGAPERVINYWDLIKEDIDPYDELLASISSLEEQLGGRDEGP